MRTLELPCGLSPRQRGRYHGEIFRHEISSLANLRTHLTQVVGGFASRDAVIESARLHFEILAAFDAALHDELVGIAEGANLDPALIVVLNHYTDLRDLGPAAEAEPDGCSILCGQSDDGLIVGQTWDMHASAMPYVIMMRVPATDGGDGAWVLSLTGCLGMAGINDSRVAVLINNLTSTDARIGVVWSAIVRRALLQPTASAAAAVIDAAHVGSGHHYLCADPSIGIGIETSGRIKRRVFEGSGPYVHANHCIDTNVAARCRVPSASTTFARYEWLTLSLEQTQLRGLDDAWQRLGSVEGYPRSLCTMMATAERPHAPATCAALAANLGNGEIRACAGLSHRADGLRLEAGASRD